MTNEEFQKIVLEELKNIGTQGDGSFVSFLERTQGDGSFVSFFQSVF